MTPHVSTTLLRTQTDERLVELIAVGHDRAFEAVVDRYRRPLLRYARRFVPEEARAEDVVQTAFVSAWGALRDGAPVRDLRPWLYRIVHNGALNVMNKPGGDDAPLIEASDLRPGPAAEVEQREDVRAALDTIAGLPDRQRAALLAVALEGRSHADVGAELGLNDTAVRQLVSRARTALRVAATAVTPWPVAVWLAGVGGVQAADSASRVGEIVGGVGAGTIFGGSAMKAGAIVAAAGAVAVSVPQVDHAVRERPRPAAAQAAPAPATAPHKAPAGASGPVATRVAAPEATPNRATPEPASGTGGRGTERSGARDERGSAGGGGDEDPGSGERGGPGVDARDDERVRDAPDDDHDPGDEVREDAPRSWRPEHRGSATGDAVEDDHAEVRESREQPESEVKREEPGHDDESSGGSESSGPGSETEHAEREDSHDEDEHAPTP